MLEIMFYFVTIMSPSHMSRGGKIMGWFNGKNISSNLMAVIMDDDAGPSRQQLA
mgnify:CR=1 FL=1